MLEISFKLFIPSCAKWNICYLYPNEIIICYFENEFIREKHWFHGNVKICNFYTVLFLPDPVDYDQETWPLTSRGSQSCLLGWRVLLPEFIRHVIVVQAKNENCQHDSFVSSKFALDSFTATSSRSNLHSAQSDGAHIQLLVRSSFPCKRTSWTALKSKF